MIAYTYEQSFAHYAPIFRQMWARRSLTECLHARNEILQTLALHSERSAYAGKLYAELDAVRDRWAAISKGEAA